MRHVWILERVKIEMTALANLWVEREKEEEGAGEGKEERTT